MDEEADVRAEEMKHIVEEAVAPLRRDIQTLTERVGSLENLYETKLTRIAEDVTVVREVVVEIRSSPLLDGTIPENRTGAVEGTREWLLRPAGT